MSDLQCKKNFLCDKPDKHLGECRRDIECHNDSLCGLPRNHTGECSPLDHTGRWNPRQLQALEYE